MNNGITVGNKSEARKALEAGIEKGVPMSEIMRLYMFDMLERKGGNKVHTAEALRVDRRTIQRWVKGQTKHRAAKEVVAA